MVHGMTDTNQQMTSVRHQPSRVRYWVCLETDSPHSRLLTSPLVACWTPGTVAIWGSWLAQWQYGDHGWHSGNPVICCRSSHDNNSMKIAGSLYPESWLTAGCHSVILIASQIFHHQKLFSLSRALLLLWPRCCDLHSLCVLQMLYEQFWRFLWNCCHVTTNNSHVTTE